MGTTTTEYTVSLRGPGVLRHRVTLRAAGKEAAFRAAQEDAALETGTAAEAWRLESCDPARRSAA